MKNTLILALVLVVFGGAYFLFVYNKDDSTSLDKNESSFAIQDTSIVGKVVLSRVLKGKEVDELTISRTPEGWKDSEGYNLSVPRVRNFLSTLNQLYVRDPITDKAQTSALTLIKKSHTEVEIYDLTGKLLKKYFVGPTNSPQTANLMLLEGAENAYLVSKPGFTGYISIQFVADRATWREKGLFNLKAQDIRTLKMEYKQEGDFQITRSSAESDWNAADEGSISQEQANAYADLFQGKVFAEGFADIHYPGVMDTLKGKEPDVRFSFETFDGRARSLVLYIRQDNPNSYFGWMEDDKIFYTIQRAVFDKFIKPREFFNPQNPS